MFLRVPERLPSMNPEQRRQVGQRIVDRRLRQHLSKKGLAEKAGVSVTTLMRLEAGLPTQDAKLQAVIDALGLELSTEISPAAGMLTPDELEEIQVSFAAGMDSLLAERQRTAAQMLKDGESPERVLSHLTKTAQLAAATSKAVDALRKLEVLSEPAPTSRAVAADVYGPDPELSEPPPRLQSVADDQGPTIEEEQEADPTP